MAKLRTLLYAILFFALSTLLIMTGLYIHMQRGTILHDWESRGPLGFSTSKYHSNSTSIRPPVRALGSLSKSMEDGRAGGYPNYHSLLSILQRWNPDEPDPPLVFHEELQHFDYGNREQRAMAQIYRDNEVPFKLYNVPEFDVVANKWTDEYLHDAMSNLHPHVEKASQNNHFLFWNMRKKDDTENYTPPTEIVDMSFKQWSKIAQEADQNKMSSNEDHYYFMLGTVKEGSVSNIHKSMVNNFIAEDLPLFSVSEENPNFFITNPKANKGIQCRFGMRGIVAEAHYDAGRNMVAVLKGQKRYILVPPSECPSLKIITDNKHPSFRHSTLDWSAATSDASMLSSFQKVKAIDTIVKTGEVLYMPSYWFHYIVSLEQNIQCNSRSGSPPKRQGLEDIEKCIGFPVKEEFGLEEESGGHIMSTENDIVNAGMSESTDGQEEAKEGDDFMLEVDPNRVNADGSIPKRKQQKKGNRQGEMRRGIKRQKKRKQANQGDKQDQKQNQDKEERRKKGRGKKGGKNGDKNGAKKGKRGRRKNRKNQDQEGGL
jgi:hypothetical protein